MILDVSERFGERHVDVESRAIAFDIVYIM